ncbi:tetratricopeptide repeat protein [Marinilactibacillus psychrotolerans]|uniref:tetratricopeptide repeat protein n=1 Tax=Marinilactibacillus psychrotolerans TaxID=191770 RepID=UPI00388B9624
MFGLFKDKNKKKEVPKVSEEILTEEQKEQLKKKIEDLNQELKLTAENNPEQLAFICEKLGLAYAKLNQENEAISVLEKSLSYKLTIGDGYKKLMSLYNAKRAEAAKKGDDSGIDYYMNKMDDMRQIAKKVTISR